MNKPKHSYVITSTRNTEGEDLLKFTCHQTACRQLRRIVKGMKDQGHEAKLIKGEGVFGYNVTEPSQNGQEGVRYRLFVDRRDLSEEGCDASPDA